MALGKSSFTRNCEFTFALLYAMKLTTPVQFPELPFRIGYSDRMVFMGSCFSAHIGGWLDTLRFISSANPTGIIYNPVSIVKHINYAFGSVSLDKTQVQKSADQMVHCDFHSTFNHLDANECSNGISSALVNLREALSKAHVLFLTFGTAIAFERIDDGMVVNNCHKLPGTDFQKRMLGEQEMTREVQSALQLIRLANPEVKVVLTVSPIRHLRHGAMENQRSKARLIRLCEMLCEEDSLCTYLPIYEFVMDELRDYRFYRHDDLIHLNELGLEMIREKIREHMIDSDAESLMTRVEKWKQMSAHRVMQSDTPAAISFRKKLDSETAALNKILPGRFF
jgi:hypothetical protein